MMPPIIHRLANFLQKLAINSFARDTAKLTLGTAISQLVSLASMPLLARMYTPEKFGLLAIFMAVANITSTIITFRYETTILLPKDEEKAAGLLKLSLILALSIGSIITASAWISPYNFKYAIGISTLGDWLQLAIVAGIGTALITSFSTWLNRQAAYFDMAKAKILQGVVTSCTALILGWIGWQDGLMVAQTIGIGIACAMLGIYVYAKTRQFTKAEILILAYSHRSAPIYLLPTAILDVVTQQLPVFIITSLFNSALAGQFNMAWRVLALPISLIGGAVGQVFYQRFSQEWPNKKKAKELLFSTWKWLLLTGLIPFSTILLGGEWLFSVVLGERWAEAGKIAIYLGPMLFFMFISSATSTALLVIGGRTIFPLLGLISLLCRPAALFIGYLKNDLYIGLIALAISEIFQIGLYNSFVIKKISQ